MFDKFFKKEKGKRHPDDLAEDEKHVGMYDTWDPRPTNFEVPDYRIYNSIEGIWELEYTRDVLAERGLKDPWMRNEIWKYPKWSKVSPVKMILEMVVGPKAISLKRAFVLTASTIIIQNIYWKYKYGKKPAWVTDFGDWMEEYYQYYHHENL